MPTHLNYGSEENMPIFIRFDDNNQRVETTTLTKKPEETGWYKAPADFDWSQHYVLADGKVVEQTQTQTEVAQ